MTASKDLIQAQIARILTGDGRAAQARRQAAFDNSGLEEPLRTLVDKVATRPTSVTDADIAAVKAAGVDEDQVFELVICAAIGQAARQYDTALKALDDAS